MKTKLLAVAIAIMLICTTCAFADFEPSIYTDEELMEIQETITAELAARAAENEPEEDVQVNEEGTPEANPEDDFMYVSNGKEVRINAYVGSRTDVVIPSMIEDVPVVGIAANAFKDDERITSIYIPDTVTLIDENAFNGCKNLETIRFPRYTDTLTIGEYAFCGCNSLGGSIALISDEVSLAYYAFGGNDVSAIYIVTDKLTITENSLKSMNNLETLYISATAKVTYKHHFFNTADGAWIENCSSLESVFLPNDCEWITEATFEGCSPRLQIYTQEEGKTASCAQNAWLNVNTKDYQTKVAEIKTIIDTQYPMPPRTYVVLQKGSRGKDVSLLQERLNELGYSVGTPDGDYGNKSVQAVSEFQQNNNLEATGIADIETQEVLFSDDAVGK